MSDPGAMLWKAVGFFGTATFASRWLIQVWATRRSGRPVVPRAFWYLSVVGSSLLVVYFGLGPKPDSVGVLGNALPLGVALYNVALAWRGDRLTPSGSHAVGASSRREA